MELDPQAQAFLDQIAALNGPKMSELSVDANRAQYRALAAMAPPAVTVPTEDVTVGNGLPARVYRPDGAVGTVAFFHGGGFVIGSVETHDAVCHALAAAVPATVVSVEYRLAPEHPFPTPVEDCWEAACWIAEHLAGGQPIAVAGDSAGGNLAAVTAIRARDREGPAIAFQLLIYPGVDMTRSLPSHTENAEGYLLTKDAIDWFMAQYIPEGASFEHPDLSPLHCKDLAGLPPALVITAGFDPLRDERAAYARRLEEAGVAARERRFDGQIHGFVQLPFDDARTAIDESAAALREAFRS